MTLFFEEVGKVSLISLQEKPTSEGSVKIGMQMCTDMTNHMENVLGDKRWFFLLLTGKHYSKHVFLCILHPLCAKNSISCLSCGSNPKCWLGCDRRPTGRASLPIPCSLAFGTKFRND